MSGCGTAEASLAAWSNGALSPELVLLLYVNRHSCANNVDVAKSLLKKHLRVDASACVRSRLHFPWFTISTGGMQSADGNEARILQELRCQGIVDIDPVNGDTWKTVPNFKMGGNSHVASKTLYVAKHAEFVVRILVTGAVRLDARAVFHAALS